MVRELEREYRIVSFRLAIPDRPGVLGQIATLLGELGANILEVDHRRLFLDVPAKGAKLDVTRRDARPRPWRRDFRARCSARATQPVRIEAGDRDGVGGFLLARYPDMISCKPANHPGWGADTVREKELRIALVCFGGVSLAVYMHGISKEILKLVRASSALHRISDRSQRLGASFFDRVDRDDSEYDTEQFYFELLRDIGRAVDLRVVVDIIAGASAGGIVGTMLARALSHDLRME